MNISFWCRQSACHETAVMPRCTWMFEEAHDNTLISLYGMSELSKCYGWKCHQYMQGHTTRYLAVREGSVCKCNFFSKRSFAVAHNWTKFNFENLKIRLNICVQSRTNNLFRLSKPLLHYLELCFQGRWVHFQGKQLHHLPAFSLEGQLLNERICSPRGKFFPLRVTPCQRVTLPVKQMKIHAN